MRTHAPDFKYIHTTLYISNNTAVDCTYLLTTSTTTQQKSWMDGSNLLIKSFILLR